MGTLHNGQILRILLQQSFVPVLQNNNSHIYTPYALNKLSNAATDDSVSTKLAQFIILFKITHIKSACF